LDSPDGELIGLGEIEKCRTEVAYSILSVKVKPPTGKHALVLKFKAKENESKKCRFNALLVGSRFDMVLWVGSIWGWVL
jgi:hypothetical protein